jgi:hypothetical protein
VSPDEAGEQATPGGDQKPSDTEDEGISPWWFIIPGGILVIGVVIWLIFRRRRPELQEF